MNAHTQAPAVSNQVLSFSSKGELFKALSAEIPQNDFHLPDFIYRADLIPEDLYSGNYSALDKLNFLRAATLSLTFDHGYPAIHETSPMWERLPGEPEAAYEAYMIYLELPEKSQAENPIRLLPLIAQVTRLSIEKVTEYCHVYFWHWRSRAYDLFIIASLRKQREQRIMSIEGKHFKMAEDQLAKVQKITSGKLDAILLEMQSGEEVTDDTKLKDLVDIQEKLIKIQRMSVGLSIGGNNVNVFANSATPHSTVRDEMKQIAKESHTDDTTTARNTEFDSVLDNTEDLATVQSLMIKLNKQHTDKFADRPASTTIIDVDADADTESNNVG